MKQLTQSQLINRYTSLRREEREILIDRVSHEKRNHTFLIDIQPVFEKLQFRINNLNQILKRSLGLS